MLEEFTSSQITNIVFIVIHFIATIVFGDRYVKLKSIKKANTKASKKRLIYQSIITLTLILGLHLFVLASFITNPVYIWSIVIWFIFLIVLGLIFLVGGTKVINDKHRYPSTHP